MTGNNSAQGLVIHINADDPGRLLAATESAKNARAVLGEELRVDIVAQGKCVTGASTNSHDTQQLEAALTNNPGIELHLCSIAARNCGVEEDQLISGASFTETATAHCAKRQFDGWAYVRP